VKGGERRVGRIALFGKSHEIWPVAALLGKDLPVDRELIVVEEPDDECPAPITIRLDDPLLARLGITARDLQAADSAIFALGTELRDWRGDGSRFLLAGSGSLPKIDDVAIHQIMLRAALTYDQPERLAYLCQPFRLPARLAEAGKFAFQSGDPRSPLSMVRPTAQMDRAHYAAVLKKGSASERMEIVDARPETVQLARDRLTIDRVGLDNGRVIEADLYIDASGAIASLTGRTSPPKWHSLSDGLPFDRLLSVQRPGAPSRSQPHAVAQALPGGLLITSPLRRTSMAQLLYASSVLTDGAARDLLGADGDVTALAPGYVEEPWAGNLVRLGSASACFGPFLSADTTVLNRQALLLAGLVPTRLDMTVEAGEFNRRNQMVVEQVRDFVQLPFALNGRDDAPWPGIRSSNRPDSLAIRIDQFRSRGRHATFEGELFDEQSWIDLMIGFGIVPERHDPMARSLDMGEMARRLKNLTNAFDRALASIPDSGQGQGGPA